MASYKWKTKVSFLAEERISLFIITSRLAVGSAWILCNGQQDLFPQNWMSCCNGNTTLIFWKYSVWILAWSPGTFKVSTFFLGNVSIVPLNMNNLLPDPYPLRIHDYLPISSDAILYYIIK